METSPTTGTLSEYSNSVKLLLENDKNAFIEAAKLLIKISNNIINNPGDEKYRKMRISGQALTSRLLPVEGGFQCLFEMGFEEADEFLVLPMAASLEQMLIIVNQLQQELAKLLKVSGVTEQSTMADPATTVPQHGSSGLDTATGATRTVSTSRPTPGSASLNPGSSSANPGSSSANPGSSSANLGSTSTSAVSGRSIELSDANILQSEASFYQKVVSSHEHVQKYESRAAQQRALSCIPLEQLQANVQKLLTHTSNSQTGGPDKPTTSSQTTSSQTTSGGHARDLLLLELLSWFKKEFFSWTNAPRCVSCGGKTRAVGMADPRPEELRYGAHRVENYQCSVCGVYTRFPRYNDPVKLLETRTGRCGEWANCFTLCCRAVNFEARYVLDWMDHVWTEVYSEQQARWLHCDPCEDICDKPLIYEAGWKKKLSYILAFSSDDIQDVTWRYSAKHSEIRSRRNLCRESWLVGLLLRLREQRQANIQGERREVLRQRLVTELVEFLTVKTAGDAELGGRVSGSAAWRVARGEIGDQPATTTSHTITPTEQEVRTRLLQLCYCCAADEYRRGGGVRVSGWHSMVHEAQNVLRKEERDWEMVYLARTEGSDTASISWKVDLTGSGVVVDRAEIQALSATYQSGRVSWRVCGDEQCAILPSDGRRTVLDNLSGSLTFTLTASLSHGDGDVAWQHTQLFRQPIRDVTSPLEIKLYLKSAS